MRILVVTGIFPPEIGGSATYSSLLLKELPKRGVGVSVLTYGNKVSSRQARTINHYSSSESDAASNESRSNIYYVFRKWPKGLRHILFFIKLLFLERKHDLILAADSSFGAATVAVFAGKLIGKKVIVRVTGDYAWEQGMTRFGVKDLIDEFQSKRYGFFVALLRKFQTYAVKNAYLVIAPSEYLKRIAVGWGANPEKVKVIYNAVDLPNTDFYSSSESDSASDESRSYTIISAGRLVPWKGFDVLIEAVAELREDIPEIRLVIVGFGPEESKLKAKSHQLKAGVDFVGSLTKDLLVNNVIASDVFVLNTAYEGFSHQIVEVMSLSVPVITTNVGGNPEIIKDGENGLLVGFNDKEAIKQTILKLYKDRSLAKKLGEMGMESAKKYTVERMISGLLKSFNV